MVLDNRRAKLDRRQCQQLIDVLRADLPDATELEDAARMLGTRLQIVSSPGNDLRTRTGDLVDYANDNYQMRELLNHFVSRWPPHTPIYTTCQQLLTALDHRGGRVAAQPRYDETRRKLLIAVGGGLVLFGVVYEAVQSLLKSPPPPRPSPTPTPPVLQTTPLPDGIGVVKISDDAIVGLSDGRAFFDVYGDQQSTDWKKQVEQFLREGENDQAQDMRNTILSTYTNDAETYSYRDSFLVTTTSGSPYFTIVIGTDITQSRSGGGRDILQGAYIAAWEYNQRQSARKVRLWIANTTADQDISKQVTNQILKVAAKEKTIIGMVGWPDSQSCQAALDAMSNADGSNAIRLPMVSPTASAVPLANYPYFFRACPTNDDQAKIAVDHISPPTTNQFIAIFKAEGDFFSEDLAEAFYRQCADKHFSSEKFSYKAGEPDTIAAARREAYTNSAPQAIYFAGVVPDLNTLIADLNSNVSTRPMIMGGDTLYIVTDRISSYQNLQFTAFAFPDEWSNQKTKPKYLNNNEWDTKKQRPMFFTNYANIFDLLGQHPGTYSYSRPDAEAIMAYDAMKTLLYAIDRAWQQANKQPTPDEVRNALTEINEKIHPLQGISGPIQFAPDGNVINKPCVMLSVDGSGLTQPVSISGTLIAS